MQDLNNIYTHLLSIGLIHARDLLLEGRVDEAKIEMNHLFVVPQLLGSSATFQHRYYLNEHRAKFVEEAHALQAEGLLAHIEKHYIPIWADLAKAVALRFDHSAE